MYLKYIYKYIQFLKIFSSHNNLYWKPGLKKLNVFLPYKNVSF